MARLPGESANDRNDRAIRVATKWYDNHLTAKKRQIRAVLLTDDADNRRKALEDGLLVCSGEAKRCVYKFNVSI